MATPADLSCRACEKPYQYRQSTPDRRPIIFEGTTFHTVCADCFERLCYFVELERKFNCPFCKIVHDVNQSSLNTSLLSILGVAEQHGIVAEKQEPSSEEPEDEEIKKIVAMSGATESEVFAPSPTRPAAPNPQASPEVEGTFNA